MTELDQDEFLNEGISIENFEFIRIGKPIFDIVEYIFVDENGNEIVNY